MLLAQHFLCNQFHISSLTTTPFPEGVACFLLLSIVSKYLAFYASFFDAELEIGHSPKTEDELNEKLIIFDNKFLIKTIFFVHQSFAVSGTLKGLPVDSGMCTQ